MRRRLTLLVVIAGAGWLGLTVKPVRADLPASAGTEIAAHAVDDRAELEPLAVPEPTARAVEYHRSGHWVWAFSQLWAMAVPAVLLLTGTSRRLRDWAHQRTRGSWYGTLAVYLALFLAIVFVVDLPVRYVLGFLRGHSYGLLNITLAKWVGDSFKGLAVDVVGVLVFAWVPFWLLSRFPRTWWLILSGLMVPYIAFVMLIAPVVIDPLFNDFGPMKNRALEARILTLARRAGIPGSRVFEVNKSVDTKAANAYVTGLLGTHRIVLWDTLIKKFDDREVLAVTGHEMGHYVLNHVGRTVLLSSLIFVAGLLWVDRAGRWVLGRWGSRLGVTALADVAATPLLLLLIGVSSTVLGPVSMAYSRYQEHEADRFTLELTHMNHSAARAFADLQRENLGIPRPDLFCQIFRLTHPCIADRIEFCNAYRPWLEGQPVVYGDRFSQ